MKRFFIPIFAIVLIPLLMLGCSSSKQSNLGLVTGSKTDEQAITEVVNAYLEAINNYTWDKFDKTKGLEFWTEEGKNDLLNTPNKLPNLEKSIKDNQISRQFKKSEITKTTIEANTANVEAVATAASTSINPAFVGEVQSQEKITMSKVNNKWRIADISAQVTVMQSE